MAVARTRTMLSESFDNFVAPVVNKPVPNHLSETKIYAKVGQNAILQARPSVVHFSGFHVGNKITRILRLANVSDESQRMHIIPPSTKYFYIKYTKKEKLVPGMFIEVLIEFTPDDWRYYYDCIRIHTKAEENLIVPIHAYPVMDTEGFPREVHFPSVPLGESVTHVVPLKCSIPVDFEFTLSYIQLHPSFTVSPMSGIVEGNSELEIKVTFSPMDFSTAHMKLQLMVSQFNMSPLVCSFTGTSEPGLAKRLKAKEWTKELPKAPTSEVLDPLLIDPLGRTRLKRLKTRPWTPGDKKTPELVKDGLRFPAVGLDNPSAVTHVLLQQPGKLKAKQIREAVQMQKEVTGSSKQMKETKFEYEVHQNIQEERQNQLRWCVRLGEDPMSELSRKQILDSRVLADQEYKLKRGDPQVEKEFDRSCVGCELRRIHRQAGEVPSHEPRFDILVNDEWSNRHMVLQKFVQAGRKVIIRLRAKKHLSSLGEFMTDWRKGRFSREHSRSQLADSEAEKLVDDAKFPLLITPEAIFPFSFPAYKSPDTKDDMDVDALGTVSVQPTTVKVKTHVPFYNLKVPKQYDILGYNPHSVADASSGYVPPKLVRPLRVGAEDEIINLVSSLPLTSVRGPSHVETIGAGEENKEGDVGGREETPHTRSPAISTPQDGLTTQEPEAVPLVVPAALFRPHSYHPMHIFNPAPGLQVFKPPLPYAEVDEDYHMCPLSRQRTAGTSAKHSRKFLERQDVIPGVMTWKRFPCQPLVSMAANPTLSTVWIPRWTDPFSKELLPTDVPPLLTGLQDGDAMSEEEMDDEGAELGFKEIAVPTPEMVCAQFSTSESVLVDQDQVTSQLSDALLHSGATSKIQATSSVTATTSLVPREKREKELNEFLTQRKTDLALESNSAYNPSMML
ncbi:LOW QUALITY PROTEIN: cilia- and flagella-associated protein 221-like [Acropora millepora]|uniref:LOW QUALITY PROTEIN: cilia- and flagella-associated protein 221-like n=1 Tax=Acropora millepora TaxID=45264 RepID=UPI001CF51560|nr:LOW QUALITY PROTEIN: cilia- and flagella-associated protein 221-like [Acropora millepora]